ncbi:hypothetical protein PoB_002215200 [Plakobranchus ocellatus]|uniref:Uncharacterized protein n=1 Tax=Plakobranchus ocellatus TaxID=259542 RepID=A0AAV3ZM94_9GAST|nr:hypothetical protein PoB_002215200 [Plakobranchus ocellatus]
MLLPRFQCLVIQYLRAKTPVAGLELSTEGSLQISGRISLSTMPPTSPRSWTRRKMKMRRKRWKRRRKERKGKGEEEEKEAEKDDEKKGGKGKKT